MSKIALVVELEAVEGKLEAFLARVAKHAAACKAAEPGLLEFTVLRPEEGGNKVFLYELYRDKAALAEHDGSPRIKAYQAEVASMLASRKRNTCTVAVE